MTAVRRSTRARHQATSIYDEAKKEIEERDSFSPRREKDQDSDDEDESKKGSDNGNESEVEAEREEKEESSDESSDEEEDFRTKTKARPSPAEKKKKPLPASRNQKKVQVKMGRQPPSSRTSKTTGDTGTQTRRGAQTALAALARKTLAATETADNSLVAALLQSYKADGSKQRRAHNQDSTIYTAQLHTIARRVIEQHKQDPNKAQVNLLNLLFRSVGGSLETNIDPDKTQLEDMDNEEWAKVVTDLVDEMRHTQADRTLLCADPDGAVHAAAVASSKNADTVSAHPSSLGVRIYRKIYEEFWYVLGTVALTEGISSKDGDNSDDESIDDNRQNTMSFTCTSRFDAEVVRDIILRVSELVTVGQPDVRAAATIAAFQLGHAVLNRTVELGAKLDTATRQFDAATRGKKEGERSRKAESIHLQMDSIKRTRADLQEIVMSSIIQGVFMHRYRDADMFIRAASLKALSRMTLQRPDLFMMDKYLKYFGWMTSDKAACVRLASLAGLCAPFQALEASTKTRKPPIDIHAMENVVSKFLPRIADCVVDVNLSVQEHAMSLVLSLLREGLFDEVEDDNIWIQINLQALEPNTTPRVRRDALYFVMDQLEAFDDDADAKTGQKRDRSIDKSASLSQSSERMIVQRLDALASWVAHQLVDGPIPIDKIRVHLVDDVVHSIRDMPEHKALVTNWAAMLRAIGDDNVATTTSGGKAGDRAEVAKQRVLVRMLACAAQTEVVAVAEPGFFSRNVDIEAQLEEEGSAAPAKTKKTKGASKSYSGGMPHEVLSVALLSSLPDLLVKFKGDHTILESLTNLPTYILPSVFSLPQRKSDFLALVKNLSDIFLESSDEVALQNTALSLVSLTRGGHTRASDARLHLQRVVSSLSVRAMELLSSEPDKRAATKRKSPHAWKKSSKRRRSSKASASSPSSASTNDSDDDEVGSESRDVEYAISLCLRRLRVLSKRCDLDELLDDELSDDNSTVQTIDDLCNAVVSGMEKRLKEREIVVDATFGDDGPRVTVPEIWRSGNQSIHEVVACSVKESLSLLLSVAAWKLCLAQKEDGILVQEDEDLTSDLDQQSDEADKHGVLAHRKQMITLLVLCFEQFLPPDANLDDSEWAYSKEHVAFADQVQAHAGQVSGDLRSLFMKEWAQAASPLLRECALTDDSPLAGGLVRYLGSKERKLRNHDGGQEDVDMARELLLPLARSVATNWREGNRREAGYLLAHVTGTGPETAKMVTATSRILKKIDPVRLLEAHMASLRLSYEEWVQNEPEEPESDHPTDEEMAMFAEAERKRDEEFQLIEQQAAHLSKSLGVGKLSDPKLSPSLLGFVRVGVKFAFSNDDDDELLFGSRLSFLSILSKYTSWIRRNKEQRDVLQRDLDEKEAELREHPDFDEVHEDDLAAIASFRNALGIKESKQEETSPRSVATDANHSVTDYSSDEEVHAQRSVSSGKRPRLSHGGSVSSARSMMSSVQNSLSPLLEEDDTVEESPAKDASPPPAKRRGGRKRTSFGSALSVSTHGHSQPTIEEGSGSESEGS